ncbi:MAG: hypothetical protein J4203_08155 [Candidatus Diapherotrites archaeon]|uniref:Uncharacterized protein n=1 Tax=Candidatus Iainarchaeum sp. TaxID=3101447 RepID=A0A8T4LKR8_9ARCH|nr:hypothetical protein [Candidatus Diapherotrites archaeon]
MELSTNSLILCLRALDKEKRALEESIAAGTLSDEEADAAGQDVLDLMKALAEVGTQYEAARKANKRLDLLPVDDLFKALER